VSRGRSVWRGLAVGILATAVVLLILAAAGLGGGWLLLSGAPRAEQARAALLWLAAGGPVACFVGGWVAARAGGTAGGPAARLGLAVGAIALLLLGGLAYGLLGEAVDFGSVAVALGLAEVEPITPPPAVAGLDPTLHPPELARERTLQTIAYAGAMVGLAVGAAGLGGLAGAAPDPHR